MTRELRRSADHVVGRSLTDSDGFTDVAILLSQTELPLTPTGPVGNGASEDPPGDIGRLQARRGAEAKPALFQGCDSWKGSQDMQFTTTKKIAAALGAGAVAVAGSGVAFAFWTTTGEGAT